METTREDFQIFRDQLSKGSIQRAYKTLISYMTGLRAHFASIYSESAVSGMYLGYMDMTYFAIFPPALKLRDLKIAIVFNYDEFRFEAWLAARNRKIQQKYWELFKDSQWDLYKIINPGAGIDAIVECVLTNEFEISQSDMLTSTLTKTSSMFIEDMVGFLTQKSLI